MILSSNIIGLKIKCHLKWWINKKPKNTKKCENQKKNNTELFFFIKPSQPCMKLSLKETALVYSSLILMEEKDRKN